MESRKDVEYEEDEEEDCPRCPRCGRGWKTDFGCCIFCEIELGGFDD